MARYARKDQNDVTVIVDGRNLGTFDVLTGGETDTTELTYKPGGMLPQVSLGGIVTVGQVVVNRLYVLDRDHQIIHWLLSRVGKGLCTVNKAVLDVDGNVYGTALVYKGTLKRVTPPEVDANSTEAAIIELEITPAGTVA